MALGPTGGNSGKFLSSEDERDFGRVLLGDSKSCKEFGESKFKESEISG